MIVSRSRLRFPGFRSVVPIACASLVLGIAGGAGAEPGPAAQAEIDHLLAFIQMSTCRFVRNGREYDADRAYRHVMRKYRYFAEMIESAEDFVAFAATGSLMSGKPYQFICNGRTRESGPTLLEELERFRRQQPPEP